MFPELRFIKIKVLRFLVLGRRSGNERSAKVGTTAMLLKCENCNCYRMISIRNVAITMFRALELPNWSRKLDFYISLKISLYFEKFNELIKIKFLSQISCARRYFREKIFGSTAILLKCENYNCYRMINIRGVVIAIFRALELPNWSRKLHF